MMKRHSINSGTQDHGYQRTVAGETRRTMLRAVAALSAACLLAGCGKAPAPAGTPAPTPASSAVAESSDDPLGDLIGGTSTPIPKPVATPKKVPTGPPMVSTEVLDKVRLKLDPTLLDDNRFLTEWCAAYQPDIYSKYHENEFEWVKQLNLVKQKTQKEIPAYTTAFRLVLQAEFGTYNQQTQSFPLKSSNGSPLTDILRISVSNQSRQGIFVGAYESDVRKTPEAEQKFNLHRNAVVNFTEPLSATELPMAADAAQQLVGLRTSNGSSRTVYIAVDVAPVSTTFELDHRNGSSAMNFCLLVESRITSIKVYDDREFTKVLATLPVPSAGQ